MAQPLRVGVYVDGYNLYYGGRAHCGSGSLPWKWLDVRGLVQSVLRDQIAFMDSSGWTAATETWRDATIAQVVYCTARVNAHQNASAPVDQDMYLKAIVAHGSVDVVEYGRYTTRVKVAPLAVRSRSNSGPEIVTAQWPVMVQSSKGDDVPDARFMVSVWNNEENGSDVNVGCHLVIGAMSDAIDAAIVVSNDSDLRFPVAHARTLIPVGVINPRGSKTAVHDLRPCHAPGEGPHWNRNLRPNDFAANQLPDVVDRIRRPDLW